MTKDPLFRKIDCVRLHVPDLDAALAFYRDSLGHKLVWRTATAAGLRLPESDAEIVIQTIDKGQDIDFLVDSADEAAQTFAAAGGTIVLPPFDIQIGRCAIVSDPWGNPLVILDMSKGAFVTDESGNVIGVGNG